MNHQSVRDSILVGYDLENEPLNLRERRILAEIGLQRAKYRVMVANLWLERCKLREKQAKGKV